MPYRYGPQGFGGSPITSLLTGLAQAILMDREKKEQEEKDRMDRAMTNLRNYREFRSWQDERRQREQAAGDEDALAQELFPDLYASDPDAAKRRVRIDPQIQAKREREAKAAKGTADAVADYEKQRRGSETHRAEMEEHRAEMAKAPLEREKLEAEADAQRALAEERRRVPTPKEEKDPLDVDVIEKEAKRLASPALYGSAKAADGALLELFREQLAADPSLAEDAMYMMEFQMLHKTLLAMIQAEEEAAAKKAAAAEKAQAGTSVLSGLDEN